MKGINDKSFKFDFVIEEWLGKYNIGIFNIIFVKSDFLLRKENIGKTYTVEIKENE